MIRKLTWVIAALLLILIGMAFAAPLFYKGKIARFIKREINQKVSAKVDFASLDLSLFRHFPGLTITLDSLSVSGKGEFSQDTLVSAARIEISVNLLKLVRDKNLTIRSLAILQPRVHAIVHRNGHANWQITKKSNTPGKTGSSTFAFSLKKYEIRDGYLSYLDETSNAQAEITGCTHTGSGDFSSEIFELDTRTIVQSLSLRYGTVDYVQRSRLDADLAFQVNNRESKFTFKSGGISLNDFRLKTEGWFLAMNDSSYAMDIRFSAPSNDFKSMLSLVPAFYQKDFAGIKTSGEALCSGTIKGRYDHKHMPAYHILLDVRNGSFQYADLPRPVRNIQFSMALDNPDGQADHVLINIPRAHLEMDQAPLDGRLVIKTPVSDPYIDVAARGRIDLAELSKMIRLENGTHLAGILDAALSARGNVSAIEKQRWEKFSASGNLSLSDFMYASNACPDGFRLTNLVAELSPNNIRLSQLNGEYLKTRFSADGTLNNPLAYVLRHETLAGSLHLKADQLNLNEWMGIAKGGENSGSNPAKPGAPFLVPAGIDFQLSAGVDQLQYDNIELQNLAGNLHVAKETVKLNNVHADALDGLIIINGSYSTLNRKTRPDFAFTYEVKDIDARKAFYTFNTVQKILPAGKYIDGKVSSRLTMTGTLNENMNVDLGSLSGEGNFLIGNGQLKDFAPLDKLADALSLRQLGDIQLKDVKTYYSFRNGKVVINPFTVKAGSIDMRIGGSHGFDQSIDYAMGLKIPRSLLGGQASAVVRKAVTKAGAHGVHVKVNDFIPVNVKVGGTLTNPVISTDLKEAISGTAADIKKQATDMVQATVDMAKQQIRDSAAAMKQQITRDAGDMVKNQILSKDGAPAAASLEDARKKVAESGRGLVKGLLGKKGSN